MIYFCIVCIFLIRTFNKRFQIFKTLRKKMGFLLYIMCEMCSISLSPPLLAPNYTLQCQKLVTITKKGGKV